MEDKRHVGDARRRRNQEPDAQADQVTRGKPAPGPPLRDRDPPPEPGFAAAAAITLALGIGASTAVFSIVYGVLLRPLPYPGGDRLVRLWEEHPGGVSPAGNRWLSNHTYFAWIADARTLDGIGVSATYDYTVTVGSESARLPGLRGVAVCFRAPRCHAFSGRFFTLEEAVQGANPVVVLSHRLWRNRYGADTAVLGRLLIIDEKPHTIVGDRAPGPAVP